MGTTRQSNGGAPSGESADRLPDEVVEELLADDRRREILSVLATRTDPIPLVDLAREVLARDRDCEPAEIPDEAVRDFRTALYERHLPKLTATDVVGFDSLVSTVELATDDERLVSPE